MLKIENLYKSFNIGTDHQIDVFKDFAIEFEEKKCTAIIGSNGCGKSTLMNIIGGSVIPERGSIVVHDIHLENMREEQRSKYIGRVYQEPSMGVSPSLTILENLSLADKKGEQFGLRKLVRKSEIERFVELLKTLDLGLEDKIHTQVKFLSGGQRQSLSLLMATMKHPKILLLDEHTAALDPKTSIVVMDNTIDLIEQNETTTIMITHDMHDAIKYSDRVVMLDEGKIVLDEKSENLEEIELIQIYRNKIKERLTA